MSKDLARRQPTIAQFLGSVQMKKYLEDILEERAAQFTTSLVSLANTDPKLAKCEPRSLMLAGLKAASLNLPLDNNLGFAYAIPYGNQVQMQFGYRAFIQLAQRSGQYKKINVTEVVAGELESWDPFEEELKLCLIQDATKRDKQPVIGYAAMFELVNGFRKVSYWSKDKVEAHGKRFSKTFNNGPWRTDFDAMAKKTVIKDLISKWGPMSTEMQEAQRFDQATVVEVDGVETPEYIDADFITEEAAAQDDNLRAEFEQVMGEVK